MRHSRLAQQYQPRTSSLEVSEAELRNLASARSCQTVAQMGMLRQTASSHTAPKSEQSEKPRQSTVRIQNLNAEAHRIHRANIRRSLERRIEAATARGDRQLLRALESEAVLF